MTTQTTHWRDYDDCEAREAAAAHDIAAELDQLTDATSEAW